MIAGALEIQLLADVARIRKDMNDAKGIVTSTMGGIEKAAGAATKVLGLLGVGLSAGMFTNWIKGTINAQDELAKMSQRIGVSVERLAGLEHAAGMSGTSLDAVQKALKGTSTQLLDADRGLKASIDNFRDLGINIYDTSGALKSADAVMIEVADQFAIMEDGTNKTALATKLFGKAGLDLIPMLNEGSAGLAALVAEGQKYNPVTAESAAQAEIFNDNVERLQKTASSFGVTLANGLLPYLANFSEALVEFTRSGGMEKLIDGVKTLAEIVVVGGALYLGITATGAGVTALYAAGTSGAIGVGLLNTSLFGTAMAATTAAGGLYTVSTAASVLVAAFAGWKIGEYLHENFLQARIAGIAFVEAMLAGFEHLKFGGSVVWETFSHSFDTATGWIKTGYAELLETIASGLDLIGMDQMAAGYQNFADQIRNGSGATKTLAERIAELRFEMDGNIASNKAIFEAMVDYETQTFAAGNAAGRFAASNEEAASSTQALGVRVAGTDEEIKAFEDSIKEFLKEQKKSREAVDETIRSLEHEEKALHMTARGQAIFNAVTQAAADKALPEQIARIAELTAKNFDLAASQNAATKAANDLEKAEEQAARVAQENWQRTHEYMTDAFVDLMDNGENAFDNIAKSFETMVKRMVAEWAASKLMNLFGMGGAAGGTASSAISSLLGGGGGFSLPGFGGGRGVQTDADWSTGAPSSTAGGMDLATLAKTAGAAWAGGEVGNAAGESLFDKEAQSNIGQGIGAAIGTYFGGPLGAFIGSTIGSMIDVAAGGDGMVRTNAGFLVGPTPGAKPEHTFAADPFASGLNITGISRRGDRAGAEAVIGQFRVIDAAMTEMVKALGGTMDLSRASLAGLDEEARAGSSGTFLGIGSSGSDIGAQINSFVDQLADHIWGLDDSLLNAVRSAGSAEEALKLLGDAADKITENNSWLNAKTALLGKYASEEQKVAAARDEINKTFGSFNREVPQSIEELYRMIETLDPLTESGRDAIEALGSLGGAIEMVARAASGGASATAAKFTGSGIPITSPFHQSIRDALVAGYSNIPAFASGGYHSGGLAIVGERGPELVDMSPARVYNNQDTTRMMRGDDSTAVEVRNLRQDMQNMLIAVNSIVVSSNKTARALDQATKQGEGALAVVSI